MKTILFFFISLKLLTVTSFSGNLEVPDVIGCEEWVGGTICTAHNHLGGKYFVDLQVGDEIKVIVDGTVETYVVTRRGMYEFVETPRITEKNWNGLMWVDGEEVTRSEMIEMYSSNESITFTTCWMEYNGLIGQIILQLKPKLPIDFGIQKS